MSNSPSEAGPEPMEVSETRQGLMNRLNQEQEDDKEGQRVCENVNSDCESDTSEVLSVGSEPTPTTIVGIRDSIRYDQECSRGEFRDEENTRTSSTPSPSSSTSCNESYYHHSHRNPSNAIQAPSPPGYSQPPSSPTASSVRSPASSNATASSPGRPETNAQDLPRYQQHHLVPRYPSRESDLTDYPARIPHALTHEIVYPTVERLHRTPISVPLVTRLSLSPPSAMTVSGIQAATPLLHPREATATTLMPPQHLHPHLHQSSPVQHVPATTTVHQHRLSVNKLLQRGNSESPVSPNAREDVSRTVAGASLQNNHVSINNNNNTTNHHNNHNNNNNNNNLQHQASLKFSIDNILKADFGRRITDPISLKKSRPKKIVPRPIDLTKDFLETTTSSSESSDRATEVPTVNTSPGVPTATSASNTTTPGSTESGKQMLWPAWVYCTRYSDRPSSGRSPRTRRVKRSGEGRGSSGTPEEKRPRTAFSGEQLARLKREFAENRYLTERRRQQLSRDLGLNEAQIKIWFQNKRAKIKKASGQKNPLALQLMAQGLYNHSTVPLTKEEEEQAAELQAK